MKNLILISICILSLINNLLAQSINYLQLNAGKAFKDIAQENDYIWAVSSNGIYKYSKQNAQLTAHYHCGNSPLVTADFNTLAIDNNNVKWFGSADAGIIRFDGNSWTIYNDTNSILNGKNIKSIVVDHNNKLWILCSSDNLITNLFSFDGNIWINHSNLINNPILNELPTSMCVDKENALWICSLQSVYRIQNNIITNYNLPSYGINESFLSSVVSDTNNVKWISSYNNAIIKFDNSNWELIKPADTNNFFYGFTNLSIDNFENHIWISSGFESNMEFSGITKIENQSFIHYNTLNNQFPFYQTLKVIADQYHKKWVATAIAGVIVFNENGLSLSTENIGSKERLSIFPNPATDYITTNYSINDAKNLSIYKINGQQVFSTISKINNQTIIDISNFEKGIYFVKYQYNKEIKVEKFVVN